MPKEGVFQVEPDLAINSPLLIYLKNTLKNAEECTLCFALTENVRASGGCLRSEATSVIEVSHNSVNNCIILLYIAWKLNSIFVFVKK